MVVELAIGGLTSLTNPLFQPIFVNILYWTLNSLAAILSLWTKADRSQDENGVGSLSQSGTYDFIVGKLVNYNA